MTGETLSGAATLFVTVINRAEWVARGVGFLAGLLLVVAVLAVIWAVRRRRNASQRPEARTVRPSRLKRLTRRLSRRDMGKAA